MAIASKDTVKVGDTLIFQCDEFRNGDVCEYDGEVQIIDDKGVHMIYLSGYRSRNDHIPWGDVIAKLDKSLPYISLKNAPYKGHFLEFTPE